MPDELARLRVSPKHKDKAKIAAIKAEKTLQEYIEGLIDAAERVKEG